MDELVGKPLTEEDQFYLGWGYDSLKANFQLANEILRQLVTLSAALLGSSVYFLGKGAIPEKMVTPILLLLLASLIVSLLGVLPYTGTVDLNSPDKIRAHKESALKRKRRYICCSAAPLVIGLGLAGLGVVVK